MQFTRRTRFFGSSTKTLKGDAYGWKTQISYLTPGGDLCPWATPGCRSMCLGVVSGHFQAPKGAARQAQARRSAELKQLIHTGGLRAAALAYVADITRTRGGWDRTAIRVNGTSDLPALAEMVAQEAALVGITARFYDYTKSRRAALAWAAGQSTVHKTFSLSESNWADAALVLKAGCNVAAVCEDAGVAACLAVALGAGGCNSGDDHDLRFLDPDCRHPGGRGFLIWLTPKGKARHDTTGFVVRQAHLDQGA